jgi:Reverse transcriptase (RNA-dependent DNA polymerase)
MASFLVERMMIVEAVGNKSLTSAISSGVLQGSILSPLCFSMVINNLCHVLRFSKFHYYAENLQLYISDCKGEIDIYLLTVHEWSSESGLKLNARQSQALFVAKASTPTQMVVYASVVKWRISAPKFMECFTGYDCCSTWPPSIFISNYVRLCFGTSFRSCFFFKVAFFRLPAYLFTELRRGLDRSGSFLLPAMSQRSSVVVKGTLLFNNLPLRVKSLSQSVTMFKRVVFEWTFHESVSFLAYFLRQSSSFWTRKVGSSCNCLSKIK